MGGLEEILIPSIITGIVFFSIFVEIRNQSKLRAAKSPTQKPVEQSVSTREIIDTRSIVVENVEELLHDVKNKKTESQQQLQGDVTTASVKPVKDAVYDVNESSEVVDITEDMRRAVIAHEILKRKF